MRNEELNESINVSSTIDSSIRNDSESVIATLVIGNKSLKVQLSEMKNEMANMRETSIKETEKIMQLLEVNPKQTSNNEVAEKSTKPSGREK